MSRRIAVLLLIFAAGSCGSNPGPGPDPSIEPPPQISCPAPITMQAPGSGLTLNYPAPTVADGTPPVTVACLPVSGSLFPTGETVVSCSATDARTRRADCSFRVTLTTGTIGATKYLAFGDSLTAGEDGINGFRGTRPQVILPFDQSYPGRLLSMLQLDYPTQSFEVKAVGQPGSLATQNGQNDLLRQALSSQRPHALLLLIGYNDLSKNVTPKDLRDALSRYVEIAKSEFNVPYVFLSNLTPAPRSIHPEALAEANGYIGQICLQQPAILVNNFDAFTGREAELLNDGLHPSAAGYEVMAKTFFDAIKATVGTEPPSAQLSSRIRR